MTARDAPTTQAMTGAPAARPRGRGARLVRWTVWLAIALAVGEAIARHYVSGPLELVRPSSDPALVYELKPGRYRSDGYFLRSVPVEYVVDERGCRVVAGAPDDPLPPVLFLGSSLVFGIALDADQTLPEALRREVAAIRPEARFLPLNCSTPGYNLVQTLREAEVALDRLRPSAIAIVVGPAHGRVAFDWSRISPSSSMLHWLTRHVRLARLGYLAWVIRTTNGFRLPPLPDEELTAALDRFAAAARAHGTPVEFLLIGKLEHPTFDVAHELERRHLSFRAVEPPPHTTEFVHPDGDHWSVAGVRLLAGRMAPAVAELATAAR